MNSGRKRYNDINAAKVQINKRCRKRAHSMNIRRATAAVTTTSFRSRSGEKETKYVNCGPTAINILLFRLGYSMTSGIPG